MKYIVSATGSPINFMLDANHKFVFDTIVQVSVTDEQFIILRKRLGVQIKEVPQGTSLNKAVNPDIVNEEDFMSVVKTPIEKPVKEVKVDEVDDELSD